MGFLSSLFGARKKRKGCDRRKKSCRRPRKYNVTGSPCNRLKKSECRSKKPGCAYVKKRGCRRGKGFAKIVGAGAVPVVNEQVANAGTEAAQAAAAAGAPIADQVMAAAAGAADASAANVESVGGSAEEQHQAAITAAGVAANEAVVQAGASRQQSVEAVTNAVRAVAAAEGEPVPTNVMSRIQENAVSSTNLPYMNELRQRIAQRGVVEFGRRRRSGLFGRRRRSGLFGNAACKTLPRSGDNEADIRTCLNYQVNGMYPCNWSGGANNRCQARPSAVTHLYASTNGKYMSYVMAFNPALATMTPPPVPEPVAPSVPVQVRKNLTEICRNLSERDCGYNANCQWIGGNRCQARRGTEGLNEIYYGPQGQAPSLEFGKKVRRYNVSGSQCNRLKKRVCRSNPNCAYTKRGCRRRSGTVSKGLVFEGPSLQFGKKRRKTVRRKKSSAKKPPAKICKLCKLLKIKTTKKVGGRRVYKKISDLKKQIKRKLKKVKKHGKSKLVYRRR